jgi:uncharacterized membrane protein YdjX (TVP38/TMEM64 family)
MVEWVQASTRLTVFVSLVILACYSSRYINETTLTWFFIQLQNDPIGGFGLFLFLSILAVVVLLPGMLVAVGTGAVYGVWLGFLINWMSTAIGQSLAFLLGRYLLRDLVSSWLVARFSKFSAIEHAIAKEDWKLVVLLRLSPLIPYNVLNYLLSVTSIEFWPYAIASGAAIIPYTFAFVYLGSLSGDLTAAFSGGLFGPDLTQLNSVWVMGSLLMMVITGAFVAAIAKRALRAALSGDDVDSGGEEAEGEEEEGALLHGSIVHVPSEHTHP